MKRDYFLIGTLAIFLFMLGLGLTGCTDVTYNVEYGGTQPTVTADQFEVTRDAIDTYLAAGTGPTIAASALFENLNDGDTSNDPTVISVRSAEHYEIGHVPGAINIPWKSIADPTNLAKIPASKDVVVYCYTGHTGAVATTILNTLGWNAQNMKFGMVAWTKDPDVRVASPFSEETQAHDFPVETTVNTLPATQTLNVINNTTSQDDYEIARAAAESYAAGDQAPTISAQDLFDNLNDGDTSNDPIVISVRSADTYAIGHIPGAIDVPWRSVATISELKKLPADGEYVVYCYTGHTGGVATTSLNMLGYDVKNLKWGMCSWTKDADVRATTCFSEDQANDYAVTTGANP